MKKRAAIKILLLFVLLLPTYSVYSQITPADSLMQLGMEAYQIKDNAEFFRLMEKIVELEPQNYRYQYNLACAYALNGDIQNSVKILQFLLDENYDLVLFAEADADFNQMKNSAEFKKILDQIKVKTQPHNKSQTAFIIPEKDLIPEGITYDPVEEAFYVGSMEKCKIVKVDKQKNITDFTEPMQDGLVSVIGMKVDAERRTLWAVTSYGFFNASIPENLLGTSGVFKYDLQTKKLLNKYMLPQEEKHFLNDLTIDSEGNVYVTDWMVFAIYKISTEGNTIEKFMDLPRQPNGIDLSSDEKKLFVAGAGIGVLDIASKAFHELENPLGLILSGDGLYYYNNSLIAVQGGGLRKISRFNLNENQDEVIKMETLDAYHPKYNFPTTGVIVGNEFYYIANCQFNEYDEEGKLKPLSELEEVYILKVSLE